MPVHPATAEQVENWVEQVAAAFAQHLGLPPITGRILGWLLICDPVEQSAAEIADAIKASRASLTSSMRMLTVGGLVQRRTRRGERTTYFRIDDDAWQRIIAQRIAAMTSLRDIFAGAEAFVGHDGERAARVRAARAFFDWLSKCLTAARPPAPTAAGSPIR